MSENIIDKKNSTKINFLKTLAEKTLYLDEFKENVILALTKKQVMSGIIYTEVIDAMKKEGTASIKMRRDVPLKDFNPYIMEADKAGIQYTLVDALDMKGDIVLVVVSKEAIDNENREVIVEDEEEKFRKVGLSEEYPKHLGEKLCSKHYKMLSEKMLSYEGKFEELNLLDRLLGKSCPICKKEKEKD